LNKDAPTLDALLPPLPPPAHSTATHTPLQVFLLAFGVFCGSSAVIMIKASDEQPMLVASYRLLVAAVVLFPFYLRDRRIYQGPYGWKHIGWSAVPAAALAIHFITWVVGVHMTQVANASLIVNMTPAVMPFFLWIIYRERVNRLEILGTVFALGGMILLGSSRANLSGESLAGDLMCFFSMLCLAVYMALGRRNSARLPLWLYMVPLYFIAGLICLLCALPFINPIKSYTTQNILLILGLGLVPTVIGHTLLNFSMKNFRGQVVSIANLGQVVFSTITAFLLFAESPQPVFYPSAALILTGVVIGLYGSFRKRSH
jgi:drug/metabolite transporter (DMT)-like permease